MSQINPFTASILGTPLAQRQAAAERDAEVRQSRRALKSVGAEEANADEFVQSADAVDAVDNDTRREREPRRRKPKRDEDDCPHVDVRA